MIDVEVKPKRNLGLMLLVGLIGIIGVLFAWRCSSSLAFQKKGGPKCKRV